MYEKKRAIRNVAKRNIARKFSNFQEKGAINQVGRFFKQELKRGNEIRTEI